MDARSRGRIIAMGVVLGAMGPVTAQADMVWPALYLEPRLLSVPVIVSGLLIEIVMLRFGFALDWKRSVIAGVTVNAISAALGVILIPLAGIGWEFFPGVILFWVFHLGTFNPITWAGNFVIAVLVTTSIEVVLLRKLFKVPWSRQRWALWTLANAASVGIAFASFLVHPIDYGA